LLTTVGRLKLGSQSMGPRVILSFGKCFREFIKIYFEEISSVLENDHGWSLRNIKDGYINNTFLNFSQLKGPKRLSEKSETNRQFNFLTQNEVRFKN